MAADRMVAPGLLVDLVALRTLGRVRLRILGWVRLARALRARRDVWLLAERRSVRVRRVAWIRPRVVRVRPLGGVGLAHRIVQDVVRISILGAVSGVGSRRFG